MEKLAGQVKNMLVDMISFYGCLYDILEEEKNAIDSLDMDALWRLDAQKKKLSSTMEREQNALHILLETRAKQLHADPGTFVLSDLIKTLSVSPADKATLAGFKNTLQKSREAVLHLAGANKQHTNEFLTVINDIYATIVHTAREKEYDHFGTFVKGRTATSFISAEV
jgi:hypothetical protein